MTTESASTQCHSLVDLYMAQHCLPSAMTNHGFQITSGGHAFTALPGRLAERISEELNQYLRLEIMRRECAMGGGSA